MGGAAVVWGREFLKQGKGPGKRYSKRFKSWAKRNRKWRVDFQFKEGSNGNRARERVQYTRKHASRGEFLGGGGGRGLSKNPMWFNQDNRSR